MTSRFISLTRSPYSIAAIGALIVMFYTFVNGYSFVFPDTRSYLRGPALLMRYVTGVDAAAEWPERILSAGDGRAETLSAANRGQAPSSSADPARDNSYTVNRSIYYGVLAFVGYKLSDSWLTVAFQAYLAAVPIAVLVMRCLSLGPWTFLAIVTLLSLFTSVGIFSGLVMPDIATGAMILSFAILFAYWRTLAAADRLVLGGVLILAALAHLTNPAVLLSLAVFASALVLASRPFRHGWAPVAVAGAAFLVGVLGVIAFDKALERATGHRPLAIPHLMASLIEKGPGYDYLVAHCPGAGFVVCRYLDRLPQSAEDFLGADPDKGVYARADIATKRGLSEEQVPFFVAVLKADPLGVVGSMLLPGLHQLVDFPVVDLKVSDDFKADYESNFPPAMAAKIASAAFTREPRLFDLVTLLTYCAAALGAVVAARALFAPAKGVEWARRPLWALNGLVIAGLVSNAFVCGMLNSPNGRYQARVIWLLPLLALVDLACRRAARARVTERPAAPA